MYSTGHTRAGYPRLRADRDAVRIPQRRPDGTVVVDATWGTVQPMRIAEGVETIGELELIEHLAAGGIAIDTRVPESVARGTIPGAEAIPSAEIAAHADRFTPETPAVLFCNGPQCAASPRSIRALLEAGCDPAALRYYRGGLQDWISLGYPLEVPE
jgi:rhodanese-related sulfurtransferase